jgi:putative ABC transport system substrate-binding protein
LPFRAATDLEPLIIGFGSEPNGGLVFGPDASVPPHKDLIISLAARSRLPAIYPYRSFAESGGLMSYGIDYVAMWRQVGGYVDRLLKGQKAGELPVGNVKKFELFINRRTAKALGLDVPTSLLALADEVIE